MTTKPNRYTFDIQAVIDTARKLGEAETDGYYRAREVHELREKVQRLEASPERTENERLKENVRKLEAMVSGNREVDQRLAERAREALRLRGWNPVNVAGIGTGISELIAFLDHSLPVKPPGETA